MKLDIVIQNALSALNSLQLSKLTLDVYKNGYIAINKYFHSLNISEYSQETMDLYLAFQKGRLERKEITKKRYRFFRRLTYTLYEYHQTGSISGTPIKKSRDFGNPYFKDLYSSFFSLQEIKLSPKTINTMKSYVYSFLIYLESKGFQTIADVDVSAIQSFIIEFTSKRKNPELGNFVYALRKFWKYLNEAGITEINAEYIIQKPAVHRKRIMPCFSKTQTDALLKAAKGEGIKKKRDYAMMALAANTGLRFVDIANLKLADVDWRTNTINIVQHKTGQTNTLPLETEVGNAIAEYILNARPKYTSSHIFLRTFAPYTKLKYGSHIIRKYLPSEDRDLAQIGFHAFRRGMGTRMLESDISISTISQVLGHSNLDSIKPYLSLSLRNLKECCMRMQDLGISGRD